MKIYVYNHKKSTFIDFSIICCGFRCKCPGPFWAHPGYSPCLTPNDWRIFSTVQMCEDINIATLSSSTWLVFTHGAVATNETGWSVPTVGLTFDDLQQNLTYVALALQRSQAHFTQPLLWVRPAGQLPQTTTRQLTSFFWKHLGTKVLVPRPYPNHQKTFKKTLPWRKLPILWPNLKS